MKLLTLPLKITVVPARFVLGMVGVLAASCLNTFLTVLLLNGGAKLFQAMSFVHHNTPLGFTWGVIIATCIFVASIAVGLDD